MNMMIIFTIKLFPKENSLPSWTWWSFSQQNCPKENFITMVVISAKITLQSLVCFWWWWCFSSLSLSFPSRTWMFGVNWVMICNKKILQCWNSWWSVLGGKSFVTRRIWGVFGGWVGIFGRKVWKVWVCVCVCFFGVSSKGFGSVLGEEEDL
jgi:hypothetical protein